MSSAGGPPGARPADAHADQAVIRRHQRAVYAYLRHLGAAADVASDLAQDAFVVLLSASERPPAARELAFLRSAARYSWLNWLRAQRRPRSIEWCDAVDCVWEQAPPQDERLDRLRRCMERLGPRARTAIALFYRDGMGRSQVARRLELTLEGAKSLLRRTRAALARCVQEAEEVSP